MNHTTPPAKRHIGKPGVGILLLMTALWLSSSPALADSDHWQRIAGQINTTIAQALSAYQQGDRNTARGAVVKAYFSEFEDSKMEAAMRMELGAKAAWEVEQMFGGLRKAIKQQREQTELAALAADLRSALNNSAKALDKAGISATVFEVKQ